METAVQEHDVRRGKVVIDCAFVHAAPFLESPCLVSRSRREPNDGRTAVHSGCSFLNQVDAAAGHNVARGADSQLLLDISARMGCAVRLCLLVAAIVLPARPAEPQELFVTGFVETGLHYRSDVADEPARPLMPAAFGGRISIYGDLFEFAVEASCTLETPVSQLVPVPATMRATLFPLSWADLSVGRFAYLPGNAIMLSPVNFACPVDL
jgi:hypothetical protein